MTQSGPRLYSIAVFFLVLVTNSHFHIECAPIQTDSVSQTASMSSQTSATQTISPSGSKIQTGPSTSVPLEKEDNKKTSTSIKEDKESVTKETESPKTVKSPHTEANTGRGMQDKGVSDNPESGRSASSEKKSVKNEKQQSQKEQDKKDSSLSSKPKASTETLSSRKGLFDFMKFGKGSETKSSISTATSISVPTDTVTSATAVDRLRPSVNIPDASRSRKDKVSTTVIKGGGLSNSTQSTKKTNRTENTVVTPVSSHNKNASSAVKKSGERNHIYGSSIGKSNETRESSVIHAKKSDGNRKSRVNITENINVAGSGTNGSRRIDRANKATNVNTTSKANRTENLNKTQKANTTDEYKVKERLNMTSNIINATGKLNTTYKSDKKGQSDKKNTVNVTSNLSNKTVSLLNVTQGSITISTNKSGLVKPTIISNITTSGSINATNVTAPKMNVTTKVSRNVTVPGSTYAETITFILGPGFGGQILTTTVFGHPNPTNSLVNISENTNVTRAASDGGSNVSVGSQGGSNLSGQSEHMGGGSFGLSSTSIGGRNQSGSPLSVSFDSNRFVSGGSLSSSTARVMGVSGSQGDGSSTPASIPNTGISANIPGSPESVSNNTSRNDSNTSGGTTGVVGTDSSSADRERSTLSSSESGVSQGLNPESQAFSDVKSIGSASGTDPAQSPQPIQPEQSQSVPGIAQNSDTWSSVGGKGPQSRHGSTEYPYGQGYKHTPLRYKNGEHLSPYFRHPMYPCCKINRHAHERHSCLPMYYGRIRNSCCEDEDDEDDEDEDEEVCEKVTDRRSMELISSG